VKRAALAVLLLTAAGCSSKREAANYRHCLSLRVGMTRAEALKVMGPPDDTIPYVEGKSLSYLKGRTAYEWSNPAAMPGPDHVSVDDATGLVENIRCSDVDIQARVFIPPPDLSTGTVSASTAPARAPAASVPPAAPAAPAAPQGFAPGAPIGASSR
jgi:hypothetical protein